MDCPAQGAPPQGNSGGQRFFWFELNLVAAYSARGERFDFSPRPQRTSAGVEFAGRLPEGSPLQDAFGGLLQDASFDIHPLMIINPVDDRIRLVFHDAWIRWKFKNRRNASIKAGHFLIPFGQNPILEPRGFFLLPLSALDLGFKRDWGVSFQSMLGEYVYEVALTSGSGLGFDRRDGSYLVSGRIGTPTYRDFQYGISALYGKTPEIRAERILSDKAVNRWRLGVDAIYKYGNYTLLKSEFAAGKNADGPVFGFQLEADYIFPQFQDWEIKAQFGSWLRDLPGRRSDDVFQAASLSYSLTTAATLGLHFVHDFRRADAMTDDRIFMQLHFYY